jgi:hypothetical protein
MRARLASLLALLESMMISSPPPPPPPQAVLIFWMYEVHGQFGPGSVRLFGWS